MGTEITPASLVVGKYLELLGFTNRDFLINNVEIKIMGGNEVEGFCLEIHAKTVEVVQVLFGLDVHLVAIADRLFNCKEISIHFADKTKLPLRIPVQALRDIGLVREEPMYKPKITHSVYTPPNNIKLPVELQVAAEVAQSLDSSLWLMDFEGVYQYYQPRKGARPVQDIATMIGRKIRDQEIPDHLKETVAFHHAAAIATLEKQFYIYRSPVSGIEMATTVIPHEQLKTCVTLTRPLSAVVSYND
jgi:hypothetical protein